MLIKPLHNIVADFLFDGSISAAIQKPGWAIITATRESADPADNIVNTGANKRLRIFLQQSGIPFTTLEGYYAGVNQGMSFLVDMAQSDALELGRLLGQESILTNIGLVYTDGTVHPALPERNIHGPAATKQPFFSRVRATGQAFSLGIDFNRRIKLSDL